MQKLVISSTYFHFLAQTLTPLQDLTIIKINPSTMIIIISIIECTRNVVIHDSDPNKVFKNG